MSCGEAFEHTLHLQQALYPLQDPSPIVPVLDSHEPVPVIPPVSPEYVHYNGKMETTQSQKDERRRNKRKRLPLTELLPINPSFRKQLLVPSQLDPPISALFMVQAFSPQQDTLSISPSLSVQLSGPLQLSASMSALLFLQALNPRQDCCPISAELFSQPEVPLQDWKPIFPTDL